MLSYWLLYLQCFHVDQLSLTSYNFCIYCTSTLYRFWMLFLFMATSHIDSKFWLLLVLALRKVLENNCSLCATNIPSFTGAVSISMQCCVWFTQVADEPCVQRELIWQYFLDFCMLLVVVGNCHHHIAYVFVIYFGLIISPLYFGGPLPPPFGLYFLLQNLAWWIFGWSCWLLGINLANLDCPGDFCIIHLLEYYCMVWVLTSSVWCLLGPLFAGTVNFF
jgi:hypothetical protein